MTRTLGWLIPGLLLALLTLNMEALAPLFRPLVNAPAPAIYARDSFANLLGWHALAVFAAIAAATLLALSAAIAVTRPSGKAFFPLAPLQQLWRVELPLALPTLVAGIRISLIISIGTATIGSTVAAKGFGEVIIAGLLTDNLAFVLQGGIMVALMAMVLDALLRRLEQRLTPPGG